MTDTTMRHGAVVRITHWLNAATFIAFVLSGIAILLAYPRLHWGEVGHLDLPAFIELPLPQILDWGGRGPGRSVHFLAAWLFVFNGLAYLISGILSRHFRQRLLPQKSDFTWQSIRKVLAGVLPGRTQSEDATRYNPLQRLLYCSVVFGLLPMMFITGLAMSPTVMSVFPFVVETLGGHQSARTLHFFAASALLLFFVVHLFAALRSNFFRRCRAMLIGH
jgi:thiosulfate reductase cytochrome b subunit